MAAIVLNDFECCHGIARAGLVDAVVDLKMVAHEILTQF
jgi:hypothetical protein